MVTVLSPFHASSCVPLGEFSAGAVQPANTKPCLSIVYTLGSIAFASDRHAIDVTIPAPAITPSVLMMLLLQISCHPRRAMRQQREGRGPIRGVSTPRSESFSPRLRGKWREA